MIALSTLPVFPTCPSYGFSSRPDYLVKVVSREAGVERRDRKWEQALHYYDGAPMGPRPQIDIETIAAFYHAMAGIHQRFRFLDYADYRSVTLDEDITPLDQTLEILSGGAFQLIKTYDVPVPGTTVTYETVRRIYQPIGPTIRIANELGVEQPDTRWTIDEDTGVLTTTGDFAGTPNTWGGEFYVACRFDGELRVQIVNRKIMDLSCSIKELRPEE
jgi:uncharacterized protein (TIGR02217 family)